MKLIQLALCLLLLNILTLRGQPTLDELKYQLVIQKAAQKALTISDPELMGLVTSQINSFDQSYGDGSGSNDNLLYALNYRALQGLLREKAKLANPLMGRENSFSIADSTFNQYHGHKPAFKDEKNVAVRSVEFTKDGTRFYSAGGDGKLLSWDYDTRAFELVYQSHETDRVVHISPNEQWLALATNMDEIDVFDLTKPAIKPRRLKGHKGVIYDLVFYPDNSGFVSIGSDRRLLFSDFESEVEIGTVNTGVHTLAISPDGVTLAGGANNGQILFFDLRNREAEPRELFRKDQQNFPVSNLRFSNSGRLLAIGGFNLETGLGYVQIWDMEKQEPYGPDLAGFQSGVNVVEFSPDNKFIAAASKDKTVRIWKLDEDQLFDAPIVLDDHAGWVWDIAFHPGGQSILTAAADGLIRQFPLTYNAMADQLCDQLARNLTAAEWRQYFGKSEDIPYAETCPGKPIPNQ